jgi:DNA polymerase-3 subunit epsilon
MLREIVLDTETTGLDAKGGDRLVELGCVEIVNRIPTGLEFHRFLCPEDRPVHPDAERIHGLSNDFLKDKPKFREVVDEFLAFIGDAPLVIHNASFDVGFLNAELGRLKLPEIGPQRLVDTLAIARRKFPGAPASLDALCKRFGVDNSKRDKHGALVDSLLLAGVYVELLGERQATLGLASSADRRAATQGQRTTGARPRPAPLPPRLSEADEAAFSAYIEQLGDRAIWKRYDLTEKP